MTNPDPASPRRTFDLHPDADRLVAYDEQDPVLTNEDRRLIGAHLESCAVCAEGLRAVPAEEPIESKPRFIGPWHAAAAAGLLIAIVVAWRELRPTHSDPPSFDPAPIVVDLVLSNMRGDSGPTSGDAERPYTVYRLHLVLSEDVAAGAKLQLATKGGVGNFGAPFEVAVAELDEWGRPVIAVAADRLPPPPRTLRVTTATGAVAEFALP